MKANPNNPGRWVYLYLQEHDRMPELWREFQSLLCSKDKCLSDIQVQGLALQQATTFRLPATQLKEDSSWAALPCLEVLGCRDYLPLKNFKGTWGHQVVWYEEMLALATALQRCTIHSGTPLGMLCRAVQEFHRCHTSVIASGDLVDLKMLDVARRDHNPHL